ncbi:hypothetical protein TWF132_006410 [Orbilia oligospora]|nr:hypothetical protein TWF132_006410 [Orbilia oligospora]
MVNKADGMFLYARLVLNDLPDLTQGLQIDNLIEELPDGLDQISLQRIISLRKPGRKYAKRVFKFVLGEQRPLRISELQQAMVIEGKIDFLSTKRSISLPLLCGSLIEIMNDDTVCLVHSSLNEYLLTKDNTLGLRHATLHRSISVACLTYLQGLGAVIGNSDSFGSLLRSNGLAIFRILPYGLYKKDSMSSISEGDIRSSILEFLKASTPDTKVTPHSQLFQVIELFGKPRIREARGLCRRL